MLKNHAIGHAIKNCCAVVNVATKDKTQDVQEAISSLLRFYLEMQTENENEKVLYAPGNIKNFVRYKES